MNILLDPTARPVIAHRGNSAHAPENTLEAFRQALALGADALELDVRITGDGAAVVIHDSALDRTTDLSGPVEALPLARVRAADAGARFSPDGGRSWPYRGKGLQVPLLEEILEAFRDAPLLIECKSVAAAAPLLAAIQRHAARERVVVGSFADVALELFRQSGIAVASSRRDAARVYLAALLRRPAPKPRCQVFCLPRSFRGLPLPLHGYAHSLAPLRIPVHVWTVDDPALARKLWRGGVCGIISNDPVAILAARQRSTPDRG
jgi:glycerophosphoryl diester phosphodiesterase